MEKRIWFVSLSILQCEEEGSVKVYARYCLRKHFAYPTLPMFFYGFAEIIFLLLPYTEPLALPISKAKAMQTYWQWHMGSDLSVNLAAQS